MSISSSSPALLPDMATSPCDKHDLNEKVTFKEPLPFCKVKTSPKKVMNEASKPQHQPLLDSPKKSHKGKCASTAIDMPTVLNNIKFPHGEKKAIPDTLQKNSLKGKEMFLNMQGKACVDLEFKNLTYTVPETNGDEKTILNAVSGSFVHGRLVAVMGPSGAGKSSLMNILAGYRTKNVEGDILVNGKARNLRRFRRSSCYIMQDDQLLPHLSVQETMMCAANLKMDQRIQIDKKMELVNVILEVLSLTEARRTRTACLSGGQRKRLSIAQELINNPPIMFFDEPTSGLDSSSCYQCVNLLRDLARGGRSVICTIHQPSAKLFEMFDDLYMVAEGNCVYRGRVQGLVPYLFTQDLHCPSYHNPADFFMEVCCGEYGQHLIPKIIDAVLDGTCDEFAQEFEKSVAVSTSTSNSSTKDWEQVPSGKPQNTDPSVLLAVQKTQQKASEETKLVNGNNCVVTDAGDISKMYWFFSDYNSDDETTNREFPTSLITQFRVLFVRTFMSIIRDTQLTALRLLSHIAVGLLIGLLYFRVGNQGDKVISNAGCLFFCVLFIMFTALMPTVLTFPLEMGVFIREHLNNAYSIKAYYLAKTLADMPFQIVFPILYGGIVYWLTDQPNDFLRFFMFLTVCVQTALVAQSLGLIIGAATSLQVAVFLGPITAIPILLFSGFFVRFRTIPTYLQWISYLSYIRYAFEGALVAIYGDERDLLACSNDADSSMPCVKNPKLLLRRMDVDKAKFYMDFIVLCIFFVILRFIAYIILKWRTKNRG